MNTGKQLRQLNYVMFFTVFILQVFDNYLREERMHSRLVSNAKNLLLAVIIFLSLYSLYQIRSEKEHNYVFVEELKNILALIGSFALLSGYYIVKNNAFEFITVTGLIKLMIPVLAAFSILNTLEFKDIYRLMSIFLIMMFISYLITKLNNLTFESISTISFDQSSSEFESNFFSPPAMGFCLFFCYFRKNKFYTGLSVIFTIMTFKRIMVLYAIFLLFCGGFLKNMKNIPKKFVYVFEILFFILCMYYIKIMSGEMEDLIYKYFNVSANKLSMGRSLFMKKILPNFTSHGFMTSTTIGYHSMEMDMPMVYVEMSVLAVIAVIYFMTNLGKKNWYSFFIVVFCLLEILTSHWLDITYFWIIAYLTIGCITYKKEDSIRLQKRRLRIC